MYLLASSFPDMKCSMKNGESLLPEEVFCLLLPICNEIFEKKLETYILVFSCRQGHLQDAPKKEEKKMG